MSMPPTHDAGESMAAEQADDHRCYWDADCELGVHCEHADGGRCCECGAAKAEPISTEPLNPDAIRRRASTPDAEFFAAARTDVAALLAEVERLRSLFATVPSVSLDGNTVRLEWVRAGRTLYLTFYDDGTHEAYFDDGQGEDWEVAGQSPRIVEAFRKLLAEVGDAGSHSAA